MKRLLVLAFVVLGAAAAGAQPVRPKADVTPLVEGTARAGSPARVALKVTVPEGLHTQSNKPRDPLLIPTTLTIDAPTGVTVHEIVWPPSIDLVQAGADKPLSVFEREFLVGVQLSLPASAGAGDLTVPARLRYQACDAKMCYAPTTADVRWVIHVVPATAKAAADPAQARTFKSIKFGTGENPSTPLGTGPGRRLQRRRLRASLKDRPSPCHHPPQRQDLLMPRCSTASRSPAQRADTRARPTSSRSFAMRKRGSSRAVCSKAAARSQFCFSCCSGASLST